MEQAWGPVNGFYITAYAAPTGDGSRYCSYAKVCAAPARDYWDATDCVFKLFGGEHHATPEGALQAAQLVARNTIRRIPPGAITLLEMGMRNASRQLVHSIGAAIRHGMA
jgi:uncharacterized membrane protein YecN with MAPEG domain